MSQHTTTPRDLGENARVHFLSENWGERHHVTLHTELKLPAVVGVSEDRRVSRGTHQRGPGSSGHRGHPRSASAQAHTARRQLGSPVHRVRRGLQLWPLRALPSRVQRRGGWGAVPDTLRPLPDHALPRSRRGAGLLRLPHFRERSSYMSVNLQGEVLSSGDQLFVTQDYAFQVLSGLGCSGRCIYFFPASECMAANVKTELQLWISPASQD